MHPSRVKLQFLCYLQAGLIVALSIILNIYIYISKFDKDNLQ